MLAGGVGAQTPDVTESHAPAEDYALGPGDQVIIHAVDLEEVGDKPFRVDMAGEINVPLAGHILVAGHTVQQLEAELIQRLKAEVINPKVTVFISEYQSQPVSVLGAVNKPGVYQVQGRKTLLEVLSEANGLRNDAGNSIKITRQKEYGTIPLASAKEDVSGAFTVAEVSVKSLMDAKNPADNILIRPNDTVSVPRAELVYVVGAVRRPGGFVLTEKETISALQAISLAEGLESVSAPNCARILRKGAGGERTEIPVDLKQVLAGKTPDVALQANDILFIPISAARSALLRGLEAAVQMGTGVVIYRH